MNIPDFSGKTLGGRYRLTRRIGYGGMATVYAAVDQQIDKPVAVKVLNPNFTHIEDYIARFRQEALSAARIPHPNLVDVTDFGSDEGLAYFVMEMLTGESLSDRLHRVPGPMRWQDAITVITQVCEALAHAHDHGVIHRDVKPGNVFLVAQPGRQGAVLAKLLDLGIAKVMRDVLDLRGSAPDTRLSQGTPGTPEYMSPEQAMGWEVDHRADIYALGVTMYRMLTGHLPFYSPNSVFEVQRMHVELPPVSLRQLAPTAQIPVGLENVVLKALAKRADERFASARELAEALVVAQETELGRAALVEDRTTQYFRSAPPRPTLPRRLLTLTTMFSGMTMCAAWFVLLMLVDIPYVREFALGLGGDSPRPPGKLDIIDEPVIAEPVAPKVAEQPRAVTGAGTPAESGTASGPAVGATDDGGPAGGAPGAKATSAAGDAGAGAIDDPWDELDEELPAEEKVQRPRPARPPKPAEPTGQPPAANDPKASAEQFIGKALAKIAKKCTEGRPTLVNVEVRIEAGRVQAKLLSLTNSRSECVVKELQLLKPPKSLGAGPVVVKKQVTV